MAPKFQWPNVALVPTWPGRIRKIKNSPSLGNRMYALSARGFEVTISVRTVAYAWT
jgi:hypothetical protein